MSIITEALKKVQYTRVTGANPRHAKLFILILIVFLSTAALLILTSRFGVKSFSPSPHPGGVVGAGPAAWISGGKLPVVNGIMYSAYNPQAVLNGRIVTEGRLIDGFTVDKILPDSVTVSSGNKKFELKLIR